MAVMTGRGLAPMLIKHGLLPDNCRLIEVSMSPDSIPIIRYEVFVTKEQMAKFAEALREASED